MGAPGAVSQHNPCLLRVSLAHVLALQGMKVRIRCFPPFRVAGSALRGLVPRCEDHCSACEGSSGTCIRCKEGFSLLGGSCVTNETCTNGKSPWP